jgi:hypothetical protein
MVQAEAAAASINTVPERYQPKLLILIDSMLLRPLTVLGKRRITGKTSAMPRTTLYRYVRPLTFFPAHRIPLASKRPGRGGRAVILLWLAACAGCSSTAGELRGRFARERGCPEDRVRVVERGGNVYRASGCERSAEYACGDFAMSKSGVRSCEERGLPRQALPAEPRAFPERPDPPTPPGPRAH